MFQATSSGRNVAFVFLQKYIFTVKEDEKGELT